MKDWRELRNWSREQLKVLESIDREIQEAFADPNHSGLTPRDVLPKLMKNRIRPPSRRSEKFEFGRERSDIAQEIPTRILTDLQDLFDYFEEFVNGRKVVNNNGSTDGSND